MLRVTANSSGAGAHQYFFGYYSEYDLDVPKWHGKAAEKLGLSDQIQEQDFEKLCHNINPRNGNQLTARNAKNRIVAYDFTFSVPKSVSLVYSMTQDKDILKAFESAIEKTMVEVEAHAETRVRINGRNENRRTGNLVWGTFTHGESRPVNGVPDPQLHKHVFIFNATYDQTEEKWKAGKFRNLKANAPYFETVFKSHFASELQNAAYQVERNERDFELKDFGRDLIEKFSNRTLQIEERAKELGITYAEDKGALGAQTRAKKTKDLDRDKLYTLWKSRLTNEELELVFNAKNTPPNGGGLNGGKSLAVEKKKEMTAKEALDYSLSHNLERKSTVTEKEIFIHALKRSYGSVAPDELDRELKSRTDLKSKKDKEGNLVFTTQKALDEEQHLKKAAREGRGLMKRLNSTYTIKNREMSIEQANAVHHALKSKDFITIISGGAGTGKTWSIKEVAQGVKERKINFGAFAPSADASRHVQRKDGFENATTIAELLQSQKLQDGLKDGVIWIDEAGLVGNKTMNEVIHIAKQQNARILLTGDIKQHNSVERGDALRIIQKYGGIKPARISKIRRQQVDGYRDAVKAISDDRIEDGFHALEKMGAIKEAGDFNSLKENVANEYLASVKEKDNVLIVATTHSQGLSVTQTIREKLKDENLISNEETTFTTYRNLSFTEAQKQDLANYQKGMSIQFHQNLGSGIKRGAKYNVVGKDGSGNVLISENGNVFNNGNSIVLPLDKANHFSVYENKKIKLSEGDKIRITQNGYSKTKQRVNNGNILSVKGFDDGGNIIATTGKRDLTLDKDFGNLTHGYYTTSPASQGKSVNKVIVMQSSMSGKAASKEQFYVSASRGKFAISIHTDDKGNLLNSVKRPTQRMTATEIASESKSARIIGLKNKFKQFGSIYRAIKSRVADISKSRHKEGTIFNIRPKPAKQVSYAAPTRGR